MNVQSVALYNVGRSARAHFTIKALEGERLNFYAYNQTVANIAEREPHEVTKLSILKSKPFSIQHSKNTIHSIIRI